MSVVATVDPYTSAKDIPHAEVGAGLFYLLYLYISISFARFLSLFRLPLHHLPRLCRWSNSMARVFLISRLIL